MQQSQTDTNNNQRMGFQLIDNSNNSGKFFVVVNFKIF